MTDAKLATLRAGCQRGEMPDQNDLPFDKETLHTITKNGFYRIYLCDWCDGFYLDALAALQEALWPGSRIAVEWRNNLCTVVIATPDGRFFGSRLCPTLATAWMDALLAGLMEKDDG